MEESDGAELEPPWTAPITEKPFQVLFSHMFLLKELRNFKVGP